MKWEQVSLSRDNFADGSDKILNDLKQSKAEKKEINGAMVLLEELAFCLWENSGSDEPVTARVSRRFGEIALTLSIKGAEYDPLQDDEIPESEDEQRFRKIIIRANREKLGHTYKNGRNIIKLSVHTVSSKNVYFSLGAMLLGLAAGLLMRALLPETVGTAINDNVFSVVKALFLNSLKMMVAPVIFFSIAGSIVDLKDLSDFGKLGGRLLAVYMSTTFIAIAAGLGAGTLMSIGSVPFVSAEEAGSLAGKTFEISIRDMIAGIAPSNLISPIVDGDMMQIIFISVLFGISANILGERIKLIQELITQMNALCLKIVTLLIKFVPAAAFCAIASMILTTGAQALLVVLRILGGLLIGCAAMIAVYMLILLIFGRVSPIPFFKKAMGYSVTPFSLGSSNASMPLTMEFCEKKLGVSKRISSFSIPLGATLNMDGTCVYLGTSIILLMNMYSVPITASALMTIVISIFVLSIGAPGVTGSGVICLSTLVVTLWLPVECIGIVIGIDQIAGMIRTASNVIGDTAAAAVVAKSQKLLDEEIYYK